MRASEARVREQRTQEVYVASYRRLVGQLTGVTGSHAEAEDVVMEAFARAMDDRRFADLDNPEAWLRTVAVNLARTRWRRHRRFGELVRGSAATPAPDTTGIAPDRVALVEALRRLPATQREAIALHHLADLPLHEVAATVGAPVGTVKARLSRGRAALAALLHDAAPDEDPRPRPVARPSTSEDRHA